MTKLRLQMHSNKILTIEAYIRGHWKLVSAILTEDGRIDLNGTIQLHLPIVDDDDEPNPQSSR